jgi:RNA polymerase sigma-70 factor (ECF subfamily)
LLSVLKLATLPEPDAEALFRASYGAYFVAINRYVVRLSGDLSQAEDIAQETFVRLWKELNANGEPPNTRAWLFHVASNLVVSGFRGRTRALRFFLPPQAAEKHPPAAATNVEREASHRQIVEQALKQLPEPMRQSLLLHNEGLTAREIGEVLGVKPSYVSTLVYRAHERFRRACDALGGTHGLFR